MLEALYMTLILFVPFFVLFLFFPSFKSTKMIMIFIQLIFSIVLVTKILYKKHSLYSAPIVNFIQRTDFFPIQYLYKIDDAEGVFQNISFDKMDNNEFSIIKTDKYPNQCLEHYFIKKDETYPITDIRLYNETKKNYNDYLQISNNAYFYYTNQNKLGKLYKSFNYTEFEENKEDSFSNDEINKLARKELNKMYNPILDFKYFIKFFDVVCIILVINSLLITPLEDSKDRKFGVLRIINTFVQFSILIIYIIRFLKFTKVKQFLFDNRDIYENDSYFPNKGLNLDSVPLAISINFFIINIFYLIFPNHKFCDLKIFKNLGQCCDYYYDKNYYKIYLAILYFSTKLVFHILDIVNELKIFHILDNIMYNWEINPIFDIKLNKTKKSSNSVLKWKGSLLELDRQEYYDYLHINDDDYKKLCGKDSLGNNLYYPDFMKCPINDIFILKYEKDIKDYNRLKFDDNSYLYFTNKKTDGKILIDFRISSDSKNALNPGGDSSGNYYSMPFYEEIDSVNNTYLYSINYLGANYSSISKRELHYFSSFPFDGNLFYFKIIFVTIEYAFLILEILLIYLKKKKKSL